MEIDLSSLYSHTVEKIDIDTNIEYTLEDISNTKIKSLEDVVVKGYLYLDSTDNIKANLSYNGVMILEDDISLKEEKYTFSGEIEEIFEENKENFTNILDLKEILWENIVLEIPLKFTKVQTLEEFNGDGWKLVSEDDIRVKENPFGDLLKDFDKE